MKNMTVIFRKNNRVYTEVRQIVHDSFKSVLEESSNLSKEEGTLLQGRFLAACDFLAGVASLFCAYDSMMDGEPDIAGLYRALGELTFGFETNQFYGTFKGFLHPTLTVAINDWLDSVEHRIELETKDNALTRNLEISGRLSWLSLIGASAFCLGGYGFARRVSPELKEKIIRIL